MVFWERWSLQPYDKVPLINSIHFHGGVTYFNKITNPGNKKIIEIGCDYSHLNDEGNDYNEYYLQYDAENTIDCFHNLVEYKIRCNGNGNLYAENQGTYRYNGSFYSNEWTSEIEYLKNKQ